jgi:ubiquinone/menaquinone biosynthesis C-methylase UbiE
MTGPIDTPAGRTNVTVSRHPRTGREIEMYGGAKRFRGKDVLDIGTGNGRLAFDLAPYARRVVGIDPSPDLIRSARGEAARRGIDNMEFVVGTAQELDVGHRRFDVALFSWSL